MHAIVYHGPGQKSWDEVPDPKIEDDTDAIVRVDSVTICGTDLHILKGDVPEMTPGRILGHEAVGTVQDVGLAVRTVRPGDRVLLSCISACGHCRFCRVGQFGQCRGGGGSDFRSPDRRRAGRVRPRPVRRQLDVPRSPKGSRTNRCSSPVRHPADGLRGRGPERPRAARRHRCRGRCGSRRPGRHPGCQVVFPSARRGDRPDARPPRLGTRVRRGRSGRSGRTRHAPLPSSPTASAPT